MTTSGSGRPRDRERHVEESLPPLVVAAVGTFFCMQQLGSLGFLDIHGSLWWAFVGPVIVGLIAGLLAVPGARPLGLLVGLAAACGVTFLMRSRSAWPPSTWLEYGIGSPLLVGLLFALGYGIGTWAAASLRGTDRSAAARAGRASHRTETATEKPPVPRVLVAPTRRTPPAPTFRLSGVNRRRRPRMSHR